MGPDLPDVPPEAQPGSQSPVAVEGGHNAPAPAAVSSPKGKLFEWCAKSQVKPPTFAMDSEEGGGFRGRAQLKLPDGTVLTTEVHHARSKKLVEHAASDELLAVLARLLGPEMRPPRRQSPAQPNVEASPSPPASSPPLPVTVAEAKALVREQARREREAMLRGLLSTVSRTNARETLGVLKARGYVRNVRFEVIEQRGGGTSLVMQAQFVRPDGATVHVMPFTVPNKTAGEAFATAQILESVAASLGIPLRLSS